MQKNQIWFIMGLIFAILVTVFALTNANAVVIHLFFYEVQASQALVIFSSAAMGAIMVVLLGMTQHFRLRSELRKLKKENEQLEKRITVQEQALSVIEEKRLEDPEKLI